MLFFKRDKLIPYAMVVQSKALTTQNQKIQYQKMVSFSFQYLELSKLPESSKLCSQLFSSVEAYNSGNPHLREVTLETPGTPRTFGLQGLVLCH